MLPQQIPFLFLILFCLALLSGIFLPIYSDEAVTKWGAARFFEESGKALSYYPQCSDTLDLNLPWIFYPANFFYSLIYGKLYPLGLRISGIIFSFFWFLGIGYWCFKREKSVLPATYLFTAIISVGFALGVMPYLFVLARPEQMLTLTLLLCFLYCIFWRNRLSVSRHYLAGFIYLVLMSCFFFTHPKTLFFLPFMIAVAYLISDRTHPVWRVLLILAPFIFAYYAYHRASLLAHCTGTPLLNKMIASNSLYPGLLFDSPLEFLKQGFTNLIEAPRKIINHIVFQSSYQSVWIPSTIIPALGIKFFNLGIKLSLYILIIGTHLAAIFLFIYQMIKRVLQPSILLAGLLAMGTFFNFFFYKTWHFYGGNQNIPISILLLLSIISCLPRKIPFGKIRFISITVTLYASASIIILLHNYLPALVHNSKIQEAEIKGQFLSIPVFGVAHHIKTIKALAKQCDLATKNVSHLVLDHMTYYAFRENKSPIHVLYVSEIGFGPDLAHGKLEPFLHKLNSPGIIAQCPYIPEQLRSLPRIEKNGYCCINLNTIFTG